MLRVGFMPNPLTCFLHPRHLSFVSVNLLSTGGPVGSLFKLPQARFQEGSYVVLGGVHMYPLFGFICSAAFFPKQAKMR